MSRPFYDIDDVAFRPHRPTRGGWGLLAPQVFGIAHYQPPTPSSARPACSESDPDAFFPEVGKGSDWAARSARRICASCPIKAECLEVALARNEEFGIWGGASFFERLQIARNRRAAAQEAVAS